MTGIALFAGGDMISGFTGCHAVVVAARTGTNNLAVIHAAIRYRRPIGRETLVTTVAHIRAVYMIRDFAACTHAIMTRNTTI
jgi:hypothetical protein